MKGAIHIDQIDQLITRIMQNLTDYHDHIKGFEKDQIIEMAGRINAMSDAHMYLTQHHAFTYEDAEYLLQFSNPLEIVADKWEARISDLSDMSFDIEKICYDKDAELNGYALAGADTPTNTRNEYTPKLNLPDAEHERIVQTVRKMDYGMEADEFEKRMVDLFPGGTAAAISEWISYAEDVEADTGYPKSKYFVEYCVEFGLIKQLHGDELATRLFNLAEFGCPNPFELRPAAKLLLEGVDASEVNEKILDGDLHTNISEDKEFGKALIAFVENNSSLEKEAEASTGDAKPKNPSVLDRRLAEHEFYKAMNKLLPDHSPVALQNWISYANSIEYGGKQPAAQSFKDLIAEFVFAKHDYNEEIATQTFHIALECCIAPHEIRTAAYHLNNGMNINNVLDLALSGKLMIPSDSLVRAEAERIVAAFKQLSEPNSPNKTHFIVPLSREFLLLASTNDHDRLFDTLKFKTMNLTNITGEKGIFVTVAKDEILKQRESQKPSDRGHTPDADQLKSLAREEAQRLIKELRALKEPNDSFSGQYTAKISDEFIKQAGFAYDTLLFNAFAKPLLMAFGSMSGEKGSFLTVSNSVRKELSVKAEKPSILGQLAQAQKEAAAQNQPGKDKGIKKGREEYNPQSLNKTITDSKALRGVGLKHCVHCYEKQSKPHNKRYCDNSR